MNSSHNARILIFFLFPYGQQSRAYLAALADAPASDSLDPEFLMKTYEGYYGPNGPCYDTGVLNKTKCYHDASTKEFLKNMEAKKYWPNCGGNDTQANGITHMPIVVAHFAEKGLPKVLPQHFSLRLTTLQCCT